MVKVAEFTGHTSRVLHLAQSPDGTTVVSGAADETLRFWRVFAEAAVAQKVTQFPKKLYMCHLQMRVCVLVLLRQGFGAPAGETQQFWD